MARLTRREMKRDELVTTISAVSAIVDRHWKSVLIAVGAVVVLAAAITAGVLYSGNRQRAAQGALAEVLHAVNGVVLAGGTLATNPGVITYRSEEEKYREVARLADRVVEDHPSTASADWALYWKSIALEKIADHAGALAAIEPLLKSPDTGRLYPAAMLQKARVLESRGDLAGAADACEALIASGREDFPLEIVLMQQARLLEKAGRSDDAKAVYRRITTEFPESPFVQEAASRLEGETSRPDPL